MMKRALLSFAVLSCVAIAVTGCDLQAGLPGMNSNGGSGGDGNSQDIMIPTLSGSYMGISRSDVYRMNVQLDGDQPATFADVNARNHLAPIALNDPRNEGIFPQQEEVGSIKIFYQSASSSGEFDLFIEDGPKGQFLQAASNANIHYYSSVPLDSQWINR